MEPTRNTHATLVDLLDRVLDKGLVLDADLIIHVAGVPLVGVKLKAFLASIETMLEYGIWRDWDAAQRAVATEEQRRKATVLLAQGEKVLLKTFAYHWHGEGQYHTWRPGHLHVTDRRVLLSRKEPAGILFQCSFGDITGVATQRKPDARGNEVGYLYLLLRSGELALLRTSNAAAVAGAVENRIETLGFKLEEDLSLRMVDEAATRLPSGKEQVNRLGKAESRRTGGTHRVWNPGLARELMPKMGQVCALDAAQGYPLASQSEKVARSLVG